MDTRKFEQWKFRIQQYLQNEHYTLWEVIEFGDSYEAPQEVADTGSAREGSAKKKGRTVAVTSEDMQKRRNDVKARTTLLLALPDKHQLRFSKYKTAQELWAAILKTFGRNKATKKTKKNQLKQQYGNLRQKGKRHWSKLLTDYRPLGLKFKVESKDNRIERLTKELEELRKEKEGLDRKLTGFQSASKDLDTLLERQRSDKNKEVL
nr:hypothetical protein [Tanacetum cinerariifolium]